MTAQHVFVVDDPDLVEQYHLWADERADWLDGVQRSARTLHPQATAVGRNSRVTGRFLAEGLVGSDVRPAEDTLDPVPSGWRWAKTLGCYTPRPGRAGEAARDWLRLFDGGPEGAVQRLCDRVGLPREFGLIDNAQHQVFWPGSEVLGDAIWITWGSRLDAFSDPRFEPMTLTLTGCREAPLSEYRAALLTHREKEQTTG